MIVVEVNNLTRTPVNTAFLSKVAESVLGAEGKKGASFSIALVGEKKAAALNKQYRKKDEVANVLAFPFDSAQGRPAREFGLGEVILCPQQIRKEAKKYGMIFQEAFAWMLIHGLLHLLGYRHTKEREAKRMEQKEHFYLDIFRHSYIPAFVKTTAGRRTDS